MSKGRGRVLYPKWKSK